MARALNVGDLCIPLNADAHALPQQVQALPRVLAAVLHDWVYGSRASTIAHYELLLLAMRRDGLREAADLWYRALEDAIDPLVSDRRCAWVAALAIDGLILRMLWRGEPESVTAVETALRDILGTSPGAI